MAGRMPLPEGVKRKPRKLYLTDKEWMLVADYAMSLRERAPATPTTPKGQKVEAPPLGAYRAEALRTDFPVDPKPVRKEGEAIQVFEQRLKNWKARNGL